MDALIDLGRPAQIQLAVLVDRGHRELPNELLQGIDGLEKLFIVSKVNLVKGLNKKVEQAVTFEGIAVFVEAADGETCERCWTVTTTVGSHAEHPTLYD